MRVVIQRVSEASVTVNEKVIGSINKGLLLFLGVEDDDHEKDADYLIKKCMNIRLFNDENHVMNLSAIDTQSEFLVISQFTLFASTKKGNRPSYMKAGNPAHAEKLYNYFHKQLTELSGCKTACGTFGANMQIGLINDGPVTIWIDSKNPE